MLVATISVVLAQAIHARTATTTANTVRCMRVDIQMVDVAGILSEVQLKRGAERGQFVLGPFRAEYFTLLYVVSVGTRRGRATRRN